MRSYLKSPKVVGVSRHRKKLRNLFMDSWNLWSLLKPTVCPKSPVPISFFDFLYYLAWHDALFKKMIDKYIKVSILKKSFWKEEV